MTPSLTDLLLIGMLWTLNKIFLKPHSHVPNLAESIVITVGATLITGTMVLAIFIVYNAVK
jgi:hypothetical protein